MSKNSRQGAIIWCPYLARPHSKTISSLSYIFVGNSTLKLQIVEDFRLFNYFRGIKWPQLRLKSVIPLNLVSNLKCYIMNNIDSF